MSKCLTPSFTFACGNAGRLVRLFQKPVHLSIIRRYEKELQKRILFGFVFVNMTQASIVLEEGSSTSYWPVGKSVGHEVFSLMIWRVHPMWLEPVLKSWYPVVKVAEKVMENKLVDSILPCLCFGPCLGFPSDGP